MDAEHTALKETYKQTFDPAWYLQYNYSYPRADFTKEDTYTMWLMRTLHKAFTEGDIKGGLLLDVGSGPTIYQVMSACEIFDHVVMSDFLEVNRAELKNWFEDNGKCRLDWSPFFVNGCRLEGRGPSAIKDKAARLRKVLKDIVHVDVHLPQSVSAEVVPPEGADCIVSCFCLDSACLNLSTYSAALSNVLSLLKPGGHFLLISTLLTTYYDGSPGARLPVHSFTEADICRIFSQSGLSLVRMEVYQLPTKPEQTDDCGSISFAKAKKNRSKSNRK